MTAGPFSEERFLLAVLRNCPPGNPGHLSTSRILSLCRWHGVGPLVARALAEGHHRADIDAELLTGLEALGRRTAGDNLLLLHRLGQLGQELQSVGVRPMLLKGTALLSIVYADPGLRPMADADLLISASSWPRMLEALSASGRYVLPSLQRQQVALKYGYNLEIQTREAVPVTFEFHFKIRLWHHVLFDTDDVLRRGKPVELAGREWLQMNDDDLLYHLCLHAAHHFFAPRLLWLYDLVLMHRKGCADWTRLRDRAGVNGFSVALGHTLKYLEKVFPGTVPAESIPHWGAVRSALFSMVGTSDPILPHRSLHGRLRRSFFMLAMVDHVLRLPGFLLGLAWHKLVRRLPSH